VAEIASTMPISRPAVSQHLRVLREARLVEVRPEGTRRIYSVDPRGLAEVRAYFEQFWAGALSAYAEHVQKATPTEEEQ
jgi:DNA-binding transcriptional ArsR family regulator